MKINKINIHSFKLGGVMYRTMLSALALLAMVITVTAQDYMFPSSNPPATRLVCTLSRMAWEDTRLVR